MVHRLQDPAVARLDHNRAHNKKISFRILIPCVFLPRIGRILSALKFRHNSSAGPVTLARSWSLIFLRGGCAPIPQNQNPLSSHLFPVYLQAVSPQGRGRWVPGSFAATLPHKGVKKQGVSYLRFAHPQGVGRGCKELKLQQHTLTAASWLNEIRC